MRWVYLSPHLDDASLSAGGLIHVQASAGISVEIWTLMCGYPPENTSLSPFAQYLHNQWRTTTPKNTVDLRRAENEKSAKILGAKTFYFDFLDCIYRRDQDGNWLYDDVFRAPHSADANLPQQIAEALSQRLQPDDVLVCQFALGSHIDHFLVRCGAELLGRPLYYVADIPYFFYYPETLPPNSAGMKSQAYAVSETSLEAWKEAVLAYSSQISTIFNSVDHLNAAIDFYCKENGGIRLWQKAM